MENSPASPRLTRSKKAHNCSPYRVKHLFINFINLTLLFGKGIVFFNEVFYVTRITNIWFKSEANKKEHVKASMIRVPKMHNDKLLNEMQLS